MTQQTVRFYAAWIGALVGLAIAPHRAHEAVPAAACAVILIVPLSRVRHRQLWTLPFCSLLGLACTRLTVSLAS